MRLSLIRLLAVPSRQVIAKPGGPERSVFRSAQIEVENGFARGMGGGGATL